MANKIGSALVTAVKQQAGRPSDTVLITTAFVLEALNEAQLKIVRETPRLVALDASDTTTYQLTTADESIDISTLDPAHIGGIWLLNGSSTRQAGIEYMELGEFRRKFIPIADQGSEEWTIWTRQGNTLYFNAPLASDYNNLYLHIDHTTWATDILDGAVASEIPLSNKGLILFALAECFDTMALSMPRFEGKALKTRVLFNNWFDEYKDYQLMLIERLADEE